MITVAVIFLLGWFIGNYQGKKAVKEDRVVVFKDVLTRAAKLTLFSFREIYSLLYETE